MASSYPAATAVVVATVLLLCLSGTSAAQHTAALLPVPLAAPAAAAAAIARSGFALSKLGIHAQSHAVTLKEVDTLTDRVNGARKLLGAEQFITLRSQCQWALLDDGKWWCSPLIDNWLQYSGTPSSPYRRASLMADERFRYCSQTHKDRASCIADQANRCYWWKPKEGTAKCGSADMAEMMYYMDFNFTASPYTIPAALTCPGTKAAEFYACFAHPAAQIPDDCKQLPGCYPATIDRSQVCMPQWMKAYNQDQFDEVWGALEELKPQLYGSCAGACWIRQAKVCLTKAAEAGCKALPFCTWYSTTKTCSHKTMEFDPSNDYEYKVRRLYGACVDADNKKDCEAQTTGTRSAVASEAAAVWRKYKPSGTPVQCKLD